MEKYIAALFLILITPVFSAEDDEFKRNGASPLLHHQIEVQTQAQQTESIPFYRNVNFWLSYTSGILTGFIAGALIIFEECPWD